MKNQLLDKLSTQLCQIRAHQDVVEEAIEQLALRIREQEVKEQDTAVKSVKSKECQKKYSVPGHAYCTKSKKHKGPCGPGRER